ncbi:MAG: Acetylornithine aminotransferase [Gammaproteobacteria bacterium]|nr:Acetylornithine aminotransferase [Gammaproteobacteria bacterium]
MRRDKARPFGRASSFPGYEKLKARTTTPTRDDVNSSRDALMSTYQRLPVAFVRGSGAYLWDENGRRYLDALSGVAVCNLGHAHPVLAAAIAEQASTVLHTSNIFRIALQEELGRRLTQLAGMEKAFFCNSGAEANEAAIKLARLHGHSRAIAEPQILVMEDSFHGRTMATLSATGNAKIQQGFEPLVQGFLRVPYGDLDAIAALADARDDIAAILVEPIQGEGGINIAPPGYLAGVRRLCDRNDWLMMLDEVQTGMCRTGRWFACQHEGVTPDVMALAKALGNGVPIGTSLAVGKAAALLSPGRHGSTFGGSPLACRAALAVIEVMERERLDERAAAIGAQILQRLRDALRGIAAVRDVRGRGMMIGIELDRPCAELVTQALAAGLLINVTADNVVRLLPPLIYGAEEVESLVSTLASVIARFAG